MSILLIKNHDGITAAEAEGVLQGDSWGRDDGEYIDSYGNVIEVPAMSSIKAVINDEARKRGLLTSPVPGVVPDDYMSLFEKEHYLKGKAQGTWKTGIRNTGDSPEYDGYVLTFSGDYTFEDAKEISDIITDALSKPKRALQRYEDAAKTIPVPTLGANGTCAHFKTDLHQNTNNMHKHILMHRLAFDPVNKEVAASVDFTNSGKTASVFEGVRQALIERGYAAAAADLSTEARTEKSVSRRAQSEPVQAEVQKIQEEQGITIKPMTQEARELMTLPSVQEIDMAKQLRMNKYEGLERKMSELVAEMQGIKSELDVLEQNRELAINYNKMEQQVREATNVAKVVTEKNAVLESENTAVKTEINQFKEKLVAVIGEDEINPEASLPQVVDVLVVKVEGIKNDLEYEEGEHKTTKETLAATSATLATTSETLATTSATLTATTEELTSTKAVNEELTEQNEELVQTVDKLGKDLVELKATYEAKFAEQEQQIAKMVQALEETKNLLTISQTQLTDQTARAEAGAKTEQTILRMINEKQGWSCAGAEEATTQLSKRLDEVVYGKEVAENWVKSLNSTVELDNKKITELEAVIESVRAENTQMREEHKTEKAELKAEHKQDMESVKKEWKAEVAELKGDITTLKAENKQAAQTVQELESNLRKSMEELDRAIAQVNSLEEEKEVTDEWNREILAELHEIKTNPTAVQGFNPASAQQAETDFNPVAPGEVDYEKEFSRRYAEFKASKKPKSNDPENSK